jgi:hypothetical protein
MTIKIGDIVTLDAGTGKVLSINQGFARIEVISVVEGSYYALSGCNVGAVILVHVSDLEVQHA